MALKRFNTRHLNMNSKQKRNLGFFSTSVFTLSALELYEPLKGRKTHINFTSTCCENNTSQVPAQMSKASDGQDRTDEGMAKLPCSSGWRLLHKRGDLFTCPPTDALAHCISEDCRMGAGIAVLFKKKFGRVDELLAQKKQPGQCAVIRTSGRFVYYMITKKRYYQKPTYDTLRKSLESLRDHCVTNRVNSISMPRIGCGLDKLKWENVSSIITEVFQDTKVSITVYSI